MFVNRLPYLVTIGRGLSFSSVKIIDYTKLKNIFKHCKNCELI